MTHSEWLLLAGLLLFAGYSFWVSLLVLRLNNECRMHEHKLERLEEICRRRMIYIEMIEADIKELRSEEQHHEQFDNWRNHKRLRPLTTENNETMPSHEKSDY